MKPSVRAVRLGCLAACIAGAMARPAGAQGYGTSPGPAYSGGGTSYLPLGGNMGGFIPYSPGPGGGLGVQARAPQAVARPPMEATTMGGAGPALGAPRSAVAPLAPIGVMRSGGGMIRRSPPAGGAMGGMGGTPRPPVGSYPFRQPPGLLGPGGSSPAMSM
jgi:hypothetical protein